MATPPPIEHHKARTEPSASSISKWTVPTGLAPAFASPPCGQQSIGEPFWRMATREQPQAWLCARHNGEPIPWFQAVEAVWNGDILPDNISVDIEVVDKGVPDAATR